MSALGRFARSFIGTEKSFDITSSRFKDDVDNDDDDTLCITTSGGQVLEFPRSDMSNWAANVGNETSSITFSCYLTTYTFHGDKEVVNRLIDQLCIPM